MKHLFIFFLLLILVIITVFLHGQLLSLGDGISYVGITLSKGYLHQPTVYQGKITLSLARDICDVMRNNRIRNSFIKYYVYSSADSYYFLMADNYINNNSYYAQIIGYQINKRTGQAYNSIEQKWRFYGFLNLTAEEISLKIKKGEEAQHVIEQIGIPITKRKVFKEDGGVFTRYEYMTKDGYAYIVINESKVEDVVFDKSPVVTPWIGHFIE